VSIANIFSLIGVLSLLSAPVPSPAWAEIVVQDSVALVGRETMLAAETKGGFFGEGGTMVEFYVDGRSRGKNLSGGDGVAFKPFIPAKEGQYRLRVTAGSENDAGVLLAVRRSAPVVLVDVEGSLPENYLVLKPRSGSVAAVKKIQKKYPIIFLQTSIVGIKAVKAWLKENGFPPAAVLPWNKGDVFRKLREKNVIIKAIVGKADVVESANAYKPRAFSFDATGDGEAVRDWDEVVKAIK
jgi:hypothetical protein